MLTELTKQENEEAVSSLKRFFAEEMDNAVTDLQAALLLKFFWAELAPHAYNRGVKDAETYFRERLEDLTGVCFEQPMTYWSKKRKGR